MLKIDTKSTSDWLTCSITKARLGSVDNIIETLLDSPDDNFRKLALHTLKMGGKKLRPSLYFLALNTGDYYDNELLYPAAALELLHIASLYHDDVMDRAELRRNTVSVNAMWGNSNAVYSGNYLFSKAVLTLSGFSSGVNRITCRYISNLCLGQLKEAENAYNIRITWADHLNNIILKTASLFELPCRLGATLSGADKNTIEALVNYSRNIGTAFQIIDDMLDLKGNQEKTGKSPGTDLREGVYTYAAIHALNFENCSGRLSDLLMIEEPGDDDIAEAINIIIDRGGIETAKEKAQGYIRDAKNHLSLLEEGTTKQSLLNLADFIIQRDH